MQSTIATLTQFYQPDEIVDSFAYTNALLWLTAEIQQPLVHYWQLPQTVILGLLDQQLPALKTGLTTLNAAGYRTLLRNSGGLAVVADPGVLNVSLFLPAQRADYSIEAAYQLMTSYVQAVWPAWPIQAGEITHSYCPGAYDLSIAGQKIAGMSQRRTASALVIMLYLSVNGNQAQRGQLVQQFYQTSLAGQLDDRFPQVDPQVMTTMADQLHRPLTVQTVIQRFDTVLGQHGVVDRQKLPRLIAEPEFQAHLTHAYQQMRRRQERLK
ncbi:lipoate--protein ligase family protein [Lactobacillus sp. CBA3605]|uniref:lipoate--protein ligase family protein n=1 Tax=Lactobacillus sp. CBA3605 TaxID=2099788 RepID=UPI000CFC5504|nr:lipoate--protein ligase family protein [Lactobacillus sp. CBA3605]AVK61818.1 lipoate--protein ligase family protein [Lactobacillus sp. CBA3605]